MELDTEMWAELLGDCCKDRTIIIITPAEKESPEEEATEHELNTVMEQQSPDFYF